MKIKIVLIILCVASINHLCAMHDATKKRVYNEAATQRLQWILARGLSNHESEVISLLDNGADPMAKDNLGNTPLHSIAETNNFEVFERFIHHGADINGRGLCGTSPAYVIFHCWSGHIPNCCPQQLALSLLAGLDLTAVSDDGQRPFETLVGDDNKALALKIIAAAPLVKEEREAYSPGVAQLINAHLPQPITGITMGFVGSKQVWDDMCWPLFEKHMAQAQDRDQVKRLKIELRT